MIGETVLANDVLQNGRFRNAGLGQCQPKRTPGLRLIKDGWHHGDDCLAIDHGDNETHLFGIDVAIGLSRRLTYRHLLAGLLFQAVNGGFE